ncbi:uncharacterized protein LOC142327608 isoform X2 [Lycorma delicatula]|uniref:uncharacterized protein LOC142327608 isoform X2 n=1 Tax=Lycorma delicatula TaxID=130591 RepID=UPI003F515BF0
MYAPTGSSFLNEDPLSFTIKKEIKHEIEQQEYLFVPVSKTDDELTISKQSVDAPTGNSFLDEDPLSFTIKKEIKHETEQTEYLYAPVATTDDELTVSKQDLGEEAINDVEERSFEMIFLPGELNK